MEKLIIGFSILYGIADMMQGSYNHLTLWTWNMHIVNSIYYAFGSDPILKNLSILTSFVGSFCIFFGYTFSLLLNPTLEYDLAPNRSKGHIWIQVEPFWGVPGISGTYHQHVSR